MSNHDTRLWLNNAELLEAADCLDSVAQAYDDEGEPDAAGASRDTAATMRRIAIQVRATFAMEEK